jgi:NCAIR mutase (PurE)-related protein
MDIDRLTQLLAGVKDGDISVAAALDSLKSLPYDSLGGYAVLDTHRAVRTGMPEVVFCPGKSDEQVAGIVERLAQHSERVLATRATAEQYAAARDRLPQARYHTLARLITVGEPPKPANPERYVAVLTAGTADTPVAEEAAITLEWQGSRAERLYDVGVAGLHRLLDNVRLLQEAHVVIVCAGMEGALASVAGGLVSRPVVAVPTSIGYGASFGGVAALLAMLNSCAGGVAVVNIDNGFGAACYAHRINAG